MNTYPRLFSFAAHEDISVQQFLLLEHQTMHFHLPISLEAATELEDLNSWLPKTSLENWRNDEWITCWGDTSYKAKDFYRFFFKEENPPAFITSIWKSKCILKHKVFAWLMLMDRINTRDVLHRRHCNIGDYYSCLLCPNNILEDRSHLMFHYPFSQQCWRILGIQ